MVNRNPISQWFITFPQWENYSDIRTFKKFIPESSWGLVVKESHKEGGIHYHLVCRLEKAISKSNLLKWFEKKFPNDYKRIDVQATKSLSGAIEYLNKEQLDVFEWGKRIQLPAWLSKLRDEMFSDEAIAEAELNEKRWFEKHNTYLKGVYESECDKCLICNNRGWFNCDYCHPCIEQYPNV